MQTKEPAFQRFTNRNTSSEPHWNKRIPEGDEDNPGLSEIFALLRRRLVVIGSVALVVTAASIGWTLTRTPKYEGKFQLLVEPLKNSDNQLLVLLSQTLKQNLSEMTKQNTTALDYPALIEVLRSPQLVGPVIEKLQSRYPEITYDPLVGNDAAGKLSNGRLGTLYISRVTKGKDESRVIEVRYQDTNPRKVQFVLDQLSQAYLDYSIKQQQTSVRQGIDFVDEQIPKSQVRVDQLQQRLQNFQQRYGVFNPQLQGEQLLRNLDTAQSQRLAIERKLVEAKSLYNSLQKQLGMGQDVAIASASLSESPQYQKLLTHMQEVDSKMITESARFSDESPMMQSLHEQKQKLQLLLNQVAKSAVGERIFNPVSNPQTVGFQSTVGRQLTQQLADASNQIQSLEAAYQSAVRTETLLNQQIREYPKIARQFTDLQRELQATNDTLGQLLGKREALRVDAAQQEIPWDLIMPPTIPHDQRGQLLPVTRNLGRNAALGGLAGLLLGTLAAFALDKSQNVFHNSEEIQRATKLPIFGLIPFNIELRRFTLVKDVINFTQKTQNRLLAHQHHQSRVRSYPFLQAFNNIYSKIKFLRSDSPIRSFAVTSSISSEGTSTVAVHLAKSAAATGARVLLVDANFHHPQLHVKLGIPNVQGLSEVLGQNLALETAIVQSSLENNLFVLTSGQVPLNPTHLFSEARMQYFVERSQAIYDLIVYDTPHLLGLLDTNLLATHIDGIVLVVGLGKTPRPTCKHVLDESRSAHVSVLGIVANTVEL